MLPRYYKVRAYNDAGVSVTIQVDWNPYKLVSGSPTYAGVTSPITSGAVASAGNVASSAIDNGSSGGNDGGHFTVYATPGSAPSGNKQLLVYLLGSDDNTAFEDLQGTAGEGYGTLIGVMPLSGTSVLHMQIEV